MAWFVLEQMETGLILLEQDVITTVKGYFCLLHRKKKMCDVQFCFRPQIRMVPGQTGIQLSQIGLGNTMRYEIKIGSDVDKTAAVLMTFSQPVEPLINVKISKSVCV